MTDRTRWAIPGWCANLVWAQVGQGEHAPSVAERRWAAGRGCTSSNGSWVGSCFAVWVLLLQRVPFPFSLFYFLCEMTNLKQRRRTGHCSWTTVWSRKADATESLKSNFKFQNLKLIIEKAPVVSARTKSRIRLALHSPNRFCTESSQGNRSGWRSRKRTTGVRASGIGTCAVISPVALRYLLMIRFNRRTCSKSTIENRVDWLNRW